MNPAFAPVAIALGTVASYAIGAAVGIPALLPILNVAAAFPWMVDSLRHRRTWEAVWRMLIWAVALAMCATAFAYADTARAGRVIINGERYRREMFAFVLTGVGAEGNIRLFLPEHVGHAVLFGALAVATGGLLAMPLGAVLMNYMAYYVGALAAVSRHPLRTVVLAWVPWATVRIASFVVLGVVLAGPVLSRILGFEYRLREERRWILAALVGLMVDVALKWALAPSWRLLIRSAAGW